MCILCHWGNTLLLLCTVQRFIQRMTIYSLVGRGEAYWGWAWGGSGGEGGVSHSKLVFPPIRHVNPEISKSKQSRKKLVQFKQGLILGETQHCAHLLISWSGQSLIYTADKVLWEGARGEGIGSSWQCWLQPRVETLLLSWQPETGTDFKCVSQAGTRYDLTFRTSVVVVTQVWILQEPDEVL